MDSIGIGTSRLTARVSASGAELVSLRDGLGRELLWQAGPEWPRHAPVLFPIVGRLADDQLRHGAATFRMGQHGFARDQAFTGLAQDAASCRLVLTDSAATRERYPFAFRLELAYAIVEEALTVTYAVSNPGNEILPASLGAHPAFAWPLVPGVAKDEHLLTFAAEEPDPVYRLNRGLLRTAPVASPVRGTILPLSEALFADDALIIKSVRSQSLRYEAPGGPRLDIAWEGFPQLGLWSRPPADFVCIEPWHGFASPEGFDGAFTDKPGLMHIAPGETRLMKITLRPG